MKERALIDPRNVDALRERLTAANVKFQFVHHADTTEVRYEATAQAKAYVDQYRLPPNAAT